MRRAVHKHVKKNQFETARARGFADVCLWPDDPEPPPPSIFSKKYMTKKRKQVGVVLHSVPVQVVVTLLILTDFLLAIILEVSTKDDNDSETEKMVSLVIIILLCLEVLVRMFVEGWSFWRKKTNIIESIVIFAGAVIAIAGSDMPVSAGRIIRPIARIFRGGRVFLKVWTRSTQIKRSANQVMARKAEMLFWSFFMDVVLVRPENIVFSPMTGKFDLAKARLNTEVLDELHIPVTVKGGFVEGVHCEMPVAAVAGRAALDEGDAGRFVRFELLNLVIVVSNGPATDWTDVEKLKEKKTRLVNHMTSRLVPNSLPVVEVEGEGDEHASTSSASFNLKSMLEVSRVLEPVRRWIRQYLAIIQNYITRTIHSKVMRGIDIKLKNIVIQYEEHEDKTNTAPKWLFGLKLGKISVNTTLSNPIQVNLWNRSDDVMVAHTPNPGKLPAVVQLMTQTTYEDKGSNMIKHLMINLERLSTFCTLRPSVETCYAQEFDKCNMKAAVRKAKNKDHMERLRLALAKRQERCGGYLPCERRGEPLRNIHKQYDYVMLPMDVEVANTLPRFVQNADSALEDIAINLVMKVQTTPISILVDNTQAYSINSWTDKMISWFREEYLLQLRPDVRIAEVLHSKEDNNWHSQFVRKAVVRQWWLHAFILIQEQTGSRNRHVASFVELQVRSRRRLEYIELVAHLMRCRAHTKSVKGRVQRTLDRVGGRRPNPHSEDDAYTERIHNLQLRMSLAEVIRSHFEARWVAGKRETALAQVKRGWCHNLSNCLSNIRAEEKNELPPERHRISIARDGDTATSFVLRVEDIEESFQEQMEGSVSIEDLGGVSLTECAPTNVLFVVPAVEFCFMLVSSWDRVVFKRNNFEGADLPALGTRRKLMHAWICGIDISFKECKLILGADYPVLIPRSLEASLVDVGARYHHVQTGDQIEAIKCGACNGGYKADGTGIFMYVSGEREGDDFDAQSVSVSTATNHWDLKVELGHIEMLVDTVKIVRVCVLVGESTLGIFVTRFVRWFLADPSWSCEGLGIYSFRLMQKAVVDGRSKAELSEESESKRLLHIMKRIFELCMGLVFLMKFTFSSETTIAGIQCSVLQPEWSEVDWARWLRLQGHNPSGTWHYPADKPTRTVQAQYEVPEVRVRLARTLIPPTLVLELPLPMESREYSQQDIGESAADDIAAATPYRMISSTSTAKQLSPAITRNDSTWVVDQGDNYARSRQAIASIVVRPHRLHPEASRKKKDFSAI